MGLLTATATWLGLVRDDEAPAGVLPPPRSRHGITLDTALGLPAVFRAILILATVGSQLRIDTIRHGEPISGPSLVDAPDPWQTQRKFIKRTIINLAGVGTAYWEVLRGAAGAVIGARVLNPHGVTWVTDQQRRTRTWHYTDEWGTREIVDADMRVLRLLEVPGRVRGLGPIEACRVSLQGALDVRDYAGHWFGDDTGLGAGVPTGVLRTDQRIDPAQADAYRERWIKSIAKHGVGVLGQGMAYEPVLLNPEDAQFVDVQQFSVTDVARMFGIPATYLLAQIEGSSMTYQNLEQVDLGFIRTTLMAYLSEIEDNLTALIPHGQTARVDLGELLRPDAKTRAEIDKIYLDSGVISPDEVRRKERLRGPAPAPKVAA